MAAITVQWQVDHRHSAAGDEYAGRDHRIVGGCNDADRRRRHNRSRRTGAPRTAATARRLRWAGAVRQFRRRPVVLHRRALGRGRSRPGRGRRANASRTRHRVPRDRRHGDADQGHARSRHHANPAVAALLLCRGVARGNRGCIRRRVRRRRRFLAPRLPLSHPAGVRCAGAGGGARAVARTLWRDGVRREGQQRRLRFVPGVPRGGARHRIAGRR